MKSTCQGISRIHAVPHFHYDVEWWKTVDGYNKDVSKIIEKALKMLEDNPGFTFVIDQSMALKPFWDANPDSHDLIRDYVSGGRIELVGGFCSPDENIPTGESLARQYIYGKKFFEDIVGGKVETAWEIDAFGHPAQYSQIMTRCGMKQFVFARGIQDWRGSGSPVHFHWEAPDGSSILSNWWAAHYIGFTLPAPGGINQHGFNHEIKNRVEREGSRTCSNSLMFPYGSDFTEPSESWIKFTDKWNVSGGSPEIVMSLPRDFFKELAESSGDIPSVGGEFNPLLTGCYESREKVKRLCRLSQYRMYDAEKWAALAHSAGLMEYPADKIDAAWENILINDFHDIICGTGTDKVYINTLDRYRDALDKINQAGTSARAALISLADTRGPGDSFVAFNSLNWERSEIIEIPLDELKDDSRMVAVAPGGESLPCQRTGGAMLVPVSMPATGFAVFNVKPADNLKKTELPAPTDLSVDGLTASNSFVKISLDPRTGCLKSVVDLETGKETLDTSRWLGNELVAEEDAGNLWTVQKTGKTWEGKDYRSRIRLIENGPLRVCFECRGKHKDMSRVQRIYLTAGSRRIDFETEVDFNGKDMRVKAMFAPAMDGGAVFETPFYSQPRGYGHWCAQNWVDVSDGRRGLAVLNTGNPGTDYYSDGIGLVLFRSVSVFSPALLRFVARNLPGILKAMNEAKEITKKGLSYSEWAMYDYHGLVLREWSSRGGPELPGGWSIPDHLVPWLTWPVPMDCWERGKHLFKYSIYPHSGDWKAANLPRRGYELNTPATAVATEKKKGKLGRAATLLPTGDDGSAILAALKKSETSDMITARVYDALGTGARVKFGSDKIPVSKCRTTNITETDRGRAVRVRNGAAGANISPWEIASFNLEL